MNTLIAAATISWSLAIGFVVGYSWPINIDRDAFYTALYTCVQTARYPKPPAYDFTKTNDCLRRYFKPGDARNGALQDIWYLQGKNFYLETKGVAP